MAGYKVRGPSSTMPGAYDVETEDGQVIPVAPSGLPEYQPVPKVEASQGDPTALGDVMTIGQETVMDAGYSRPGLPAKAEMPRLPMPARAPREPKAVDPAALVGKTPEPPPGAPSSGPMPGAPSTDPRDAVAAVVAEKKAIEEAFGKGVYTGPPTTRKTETSYEGRDLSADAEARVAYLAKTAADKGAEAMAARERMAQTESDAAAAQAKALEEREKVVAEERERMTERQAQIRSQVASVREQAMADDASADALQERYGTQDSLRRVIGAVGMFFAGQTGNPQATIGFINAGIDDAWRRDMENLKRADGKGAAKRSYAAQLLQETGDEEAAYHRFRAEALENYSAKAEKLALRSGSQNALDKFAEFKAASQQSQAESEQAAIISNAPLTKVSETGTERFGGVRGGASKDDIKRVQQLTDEGRKEGVSVRADVRKSTLDAEKSGKQADPGKEYETYSRAGNTLQEVASESRKKNGIVFDAADRDVKAMKGRASDALAALGLKSQAKAAEEAESQAELDAIVASGIRDAGSLVSSAKANMGTGQRISVKDSERVDAQLAGKP